MPLSAALLCLVVAIQDGDSLTAKCSDSTEKVRLAEIDAPERGQAWGARSRQSLSDLCFGLEVILTPTATDRYGRMVARASCQGEDASLHQVKRGMAWAYTKYLTDQSVKQAEDSAREGRIGLWADPSPVPPWEWRRTK